MTIEDQKAQANALNAACTLVQLDPTAQRDLAAYLLDLSNTTDKDERQYIFEAINEILFIGGNEDGPDLAGWESEAANGPAGAAALAELEGSDAVFARNYSEAKAASGLHTIRQVAEAAGISPTTVNAIEKSHVRPQYKTIAALAKAFNIPVEKLTK